MGLPGLSAFISEVLVLLGAWPVYPALTVIAASAVVLTAGYLLWTLQRMYLGPPNEKYRTLPEITAREVFTLAPLAVIVVFLGIYPAPILNLQSPALLRLNEQVRSSTPTHPSAEMVAAGDKPTETR
jgi:NADH-quinone oxidoreductase subunit M